ncbi:hypothetical protein Tco_0678155 [Tanacetum coccineum]|uniref:Uncharacterized protein n=1 Tax=Tanacetum coccineum TaxID=301880 RepID=A0ABQ4XEG1_9ASTR
MFYLPLHPPEFCSIGDELRDEDTKEDESSDTNDERENDEGQQQAVLVVDTAASEPLGLGYGAAKSRALQSTEEIAPSKYEVEQSSRSMPEHEGAERVSAFTQTILVTWVDPEDGKVYTDILTYVPLAAPVQTPPSPDWSLGSLPISPSSSIVPSPIASPVATPAATISVDEDHFLEVGVQLEIHGSILHDHTQHLDVLPPTLFEVYDRDLRELYTRSVAVRDAIFSQSYRFRSLVREQERATETFSATWRPVLALEAWAGQTDAQRQLAEEMRERLELADRVGRMEKTHESGEE